MSEVTDWVPATPAAKPVTNINDIGNSTYQEAALGLDSTEASNEPKIQNKRKSPNDQLNEKPRKRTRMKRHRPKIFDSSKPKKIPKHKVVNPKTPKQKTPAHAIPSTSPSESRTYLRRKCNLETLVDANKVSCKKKLNFSQDEPSSIEEDGFSLQNVDGQIQVDDFQVPTNSSDVACDPGFPNICKKVRMQRRRATVFDKLGIVMTTNVCLKKVNPLLENEKSAHNRAPGRQTRLAMDDPVSFKCVLSLSISVKVRKKRSLRLRPALKLRRQDDCKPEACVQVQDEDSRNLAIEDLVEQSDLAADNVAIPDNSVEACVQVEDEGSQNLVTEDLVDRMEFAGDNVTFPDNIVAPEKAVSSCHMDIQKNIRKKILHKFIRKYVAKLIPMKRKKLIPNIDALIDKNSKRLERLSINDENNQLVVVHKKGHNKLGVVDKKGHGALVTFVDHKKRKRQSRVHLDAETRRVWNLKLEKVDRDANEPPTHEKTEEYWEKERELLRARAEFFMACMHQVLGDRRFTKWKGSVVDSVIGVFLTQNVSDSLSSASFMDLAAAYPPVITNSEDCFMDLPRSQESTGSNIVLSQEVANDEIEDENCIPISTTIVPDLIGGGVTGEDEPASTSTNSFNTQVGAESSNGDKACSHVESSSSGKRKKKVNDTQEEKIDWDALRKKYKMDQKVDTTDSVNWEAVRKAPVDALAELIAKRGMHNVLAAKIQNFLERVHKDHDSLDLEWLRDCPPEEAKAYLLSISGLGLKSVECVRLLALHHPAFPVDTNIGRILVRLGWVPLQPLPEDVQIHLLNQYPLLDNIQKYIWPRLCHLDTIQLYEFHYQLITAGKVFCTKKAPNCNACPMRGECKHFASALASSKLRLEGPGGRNTTNEFPVTHGQDLLNPQLLSLPEIRNESQNCGPIVDVPPSPEHSPQETVSVPVIDLEDSDSEEVIRTIRLNVEKYAQIGSNALVPVNPYAASIPMPKLKHVERLRTIHQVLRNESLMIPARTFLQYGQQTTHQSLPNSQLIMMHPAQEILINSKMTSLFEERFLYHAGHLTEVHFHSMGHTFRSMRFLQIMKRVNIHYLFLENGFGICRDEKSVVEEL